MVIAGRRVGVRGGCTHRHCPDLSVYYAEYENHSAGGWWVRVPPPLSLPQLGMVGCSSVFGWFNACSRVRVETSSTRRPEQGFPLARPRRCRCFM